MPNAAYITLIVAGSDCLCQDEIRDSKKAHICKSYFVFFVAFVALFIDLRTPETHKTTTFELLTLF